jgi:hypothetical protein
MHQRRIYHSSNGDSWWLTEAEDGRVVVRHEANEASGGKVSEISLGDFLGTGQSGPEHQALLTMIGGLVGPPT